VVGSDPRSLYERWLFELWTTADRGLAGELVTAEFVGHWPDQDVCGPDELVAVIGQSLSFFSDVTTSIDLGPIVEGDLLAARWGFRGGYAGGMPGATAPAGTPLMLRGADMMRLAGGRFAEYWVSSDATQLAQQLGVSAG
jgi:hypothetical protein